ncbi:MAG: GntR family transcriptional regulator [Pirellulales bacterium]|nr:GntR family transcriptional regulator [Pirellulales bacterium]
MTWADYICQDLTTRIREGLELPERITLQALAKHYSVSITPVRKAIGRLIDQKVLLKGDNNRLTLNPRKRAARNARKKGDSAVSLPAPPQDPFKTVTRHFVRLSLRGKPVSLKESELAKQFGIGTRRVRELLHRLSGMGVVEHLPRKGWRLIPFNENALDEYIDTRTVLELRALELAMPHLVKADLQKIRHANVLLQGNDHPLLIDHSLHFYIIEKSGNRYIADFFERHHPYYELLLDYETQHFAIDSIRQQALELHIQVIDALIAGDLATAKDALQQDLEIPHPFFEMHRAAQEAVTSGEMPTRGAAPSWRPALSSLLAIGVVANYLIAIMSSITAS